LLLSGQQSIVIAIDVRDDGVRQRDPRRQIQFDLHAIRVDGEPRGLKVLVGPMRRQLRPTGDGQGQHQHAGGTATSA
jgi:hypothetical protein